MLSVPRRSKTEKLSSQVRQWQTFQIPSPLTKTPQNRKPMIFLSSRDQDPESPKPEANSQAEEAGKHDRGPRRLFYGLVVVGSEYNSMI